MGEGLKRARAAAKATRKPEDDSYMALYRAVATYVEQHGGKVLVAGGIQIQEFPAGAKYNFYVAVKCTGRKPVFEGKERA